MRQVSQVSRDNWNRAISMANERKNASAKIYGNRMGRNEYNGKQICSMSISGKGGGRRGVGGKLNGNSNTIDVNSRPGHNNSDKYVNINSYSYTYTYT